MIKYQLPEIYHKILPTELLQAEVAETKATCGNCNWSAYKNHLKCCTYEPYLPNYLVGALLENPATPESTREILRRKIERREFSLPIGLMASVRFQVTFNNRQPQDFGNREDWLCPYYDRQNQNCGIWRNRGAVCTTYYCQSNSGKKGIQFWERFSDYLTYVEMALMEDVLVHMGYSPRQISDCLEYINRQEGSPAEMRSDSLPLAKAQRLWGDFFDKQEQFFRKTYLMVKEFDKKRFREALGEMGADIEESLFDDLRKIV